MKNMKKKGFTLVELLVVIAIVAILATVSVVGYTVFINRANMSADQQAVTQMNTMLEALDVNNEPETYVDLIAYLNSTGLDADDYKALSDGHAFVWDSGLNRVLLLNEDGDVVYPEDIEGADPSKWFYLHEDDMDLDDTPAVDANGAVAIGSASDLITSIRDNASALKEMNLTGNINMMGMSSFITATNQSLTITGGENGATVSNLVSTEYAQLGKGSAKSPSSQNQKYATGLIGKTGAGAQTIVIENVVFDGLTIGSYDTAIVGLIMGTLNGDDTLILRNVTFKNCTVYGQNKVGLICGYIYGTLILDNVTIENCTVNASEGESGVLFGVATNSADLSEATDFEITGTKVNNVEYGNHEIVKVGDANYITKVNGNGETDIKTIDGTSYTAVCACATDATLGWRYPAVYSYEPLDNTYCGRPAVEVTTLD